jgi:hypothetical protein
MRPCRLAACSGAGLAGESRGHRKVGVPGGALPGRGLGGTRQIRKPAGNGSSGRRTSWEMPPR